MSGLELQPSLTFFRSVPQNMMSQPPLCSSLQHLEACFLLIAHQRYPQALVACASAVESALKARFGENDHLSFEKLIDRARTQFAGIAALDAEAVSQFRKLRNEIIHRGYAPKDDEIAAASLLKAGFRFVSACYRDFFGFDLYDGLSDGYAHHLQVAQEVYDATDDIDGYRHTQCLLAFGHLVGWQEIKEIFTAAWEFRAVDDDERFDYCERRRRRLQMKFDVPCELRCPVCQESEALICDLDDNRLDAGDVSIQLAVCVNCDLVIPRDCLFLADALCRDQIERDKSKIVNSFIVIG